MNTSNLKQGRTIHWIGWQILIFPLLEITELRYGHRLIKHEFQIRWASLVSYTKESACQCRRHEFYPWAGKIPLEKGMATDSSILAWRIPWTEQPVGLLSIEAHRVRHDWSNLTCTHALEKEMATNSSVLAWRIPWTEELGGLLSMGSHRVRHDWEIFTFFFQTRWKSPVIQGCRQNCGCQDGMYAKEKEIFSPNMQGENFI